MSRMISVPLAAKLPMKRTLAAEDRPSIESVEKELARLTEDVLESMFARPDKKKDHK